MKRLSVEWVPETRRILSLTIATPQNTADTPRQFVLEQAIEVDEPAPRSRLIVISGVRELRAQVMTAIPLEAA